LFLAGLFFFFFCGIALAETKEVVVNGENVIYDKANYLVEATGSVEVIYSDVKITGQSITYNTKLNHAWADRGFVLSYKDITVEGKTLDYDLKAKSGTATDVQLIYKGVLLAGKKINLIGTEFQLSNAIFSTCDLPSPHYRVTASDINFYRTSGWLVAYWGYFWLGPVPVVPMPTYIYDLSGKDHGIVPFPEIGGDTDYGTYINERLAWYLNPQLSGSYSLSYATKKGLGGGGEANYVINQDSRGNARLYYNGNDGPFGGITHSLYFGEEVSTPMSQSLGFLQMPKQRRFELDTMLSYRERINYQHISYYPNLVFKGRGLKIFSDDVKLDVDLAAGLVAERYNTKQAEGSSKFNFAWSLPEMAVGSFTPTLGIDERFYSNGSRWGNEIAGLSLLRKFPGQVEGRLGYSHYLLNQGVSPFNFEMYRFRAADRLTGELNFFIGETGCDIYAAYFLDTWKPDDIDYALKVRMHCYNFEVKYRSMRGEFNFGFSLAETQ
jgi:hypothetical protein